MNKYKIKNKIDRTYEIYGKGLLELFKYREIEEQFDNYRLDVDIQSVTLEYKLDKSEECVNVDNYSNPMEFLEENHYGKTTAWNRWNDQKIKLITTLAECDNEVQSIYEYLDELPICAVRLPFSKQLMASACMLLEVAASIEEELAGEVYRDTNHLTWDDFKWLLAISSNEADLREVVQKYCCDW